MGVTQAMSDVSQGACKRCGHTVPNPKQNTGSLHPGVPAIPARAPAPEVLRPSSFQRKKDPKKNPCGAVSARSSRHAELVAIVVFGRPAAVSGDNLFTLASKSTLNQFLVFRVVF